MASARSSGVGEVSRLNTTDHQRFQLTGCSRLEHRDGIQSCLGRQGLDAPLGTDVDPGLCVADRPGTGQESGQAAGLDRTAITRAARHPREPGTRPGYCGECAGGQSSPLPHQDDVVRAEVERTHRVRLCAGNGGNQRRVQLCGCRCSGRTQTAVTANALLADALAPAAGRSPQPPPRAQGRPGRRDLRSPGPRRSRPGRAPCRRPLPPGNRPRRPPIGRERKSMLFVPSTARANLL